MSLLSFDIEISDVFDLAPGEDLDDHAPFHISIASTAVHGGEERLWYSTKDDGTPSINITRERASELLDYLETMQQREDLKVCAWNGPRPGRYAPQGARRMTGHSQPPSVRQYMLPSSDCS